MFEENIREISAIKQNFENEVDDIFGKSVSEKCIEPMMSHFHYISQANERYIAQEQMIKGILNTLRMII